MAHSIIPYEGNEPYIFVSYSHSDSSRVFPILEKLQNLGYRIWFDKGIELGTEWSESIAVHLSACTVCMAFISRDSVQSMNCRQEIGYALKQKKSILSVFLEDTDLSMGLDMQLSAYQQIYVNQYSDKALFYDRLAKVPILQPCKQQDTAGEDGGKTRSGNGRRRHIVLLMAAVIAVAVLAGAGIWSWLSSDKKAAPAEMVSMPYHVILTADEDCSIREFNDAVNILKGRLDVFAGDTDYKMTVNDDTIDLQMPRELFGDEDLTQMLRCYFSRACELFAFNLEDNSQHVALSRSDLESVTLKHGAIEGVDAAERGVTDENYPYIEVVLTEDCARRLSTEIKSWGEGFSFAQDMQMDEWYYFYTYPAGDGRTFRILNNDRGGRYSEVVAYNLAHDSYGFHFGFSIVLDDIRWEDPEDSSAGKNQCRGEDITEKSVIIPFRSTDTPTAGEWIDSKAVFRTRMDALEQPYAIGMRDGNPNILYIKTGLNHMGPDIISLLSAYTSTSSSFTLRAACMEATFSSKSVQIVELPDGRYGFQLQFNESTREDICNFISYAIENDSEIALVINAFPLCAAKLDAVPDDNSLTLDRLMFKADSVIREEDLWLLHLLESISCGPNMPIMFFSDRYSFNPDADGIMPTEEDFGAKNENLIAHQEDFVRTIAELYPDAEVQFNNREAKVFFNMDIDAYLPERSTERAKTIYNETDFEHSMFTFIGIYLVDEDDTADERARIFFRKYYYDYGYYKDDPDKKFIVSHGIFQGGRLEPFAQAFKEAIFSDSFYMDKTEEESDWWISMPAL